MSAATKTREPNDKTIRSWISAELCRTSGILIEDLDEETQMQLVEAFDNVGDVRKVLKMWRSK